MLTEKKNLKEKVFKKQVFFCFCFSPSVIVVRFVEKTQEKTDGPIWKIQKSKAKKQVFSFPQVKPFIVIIVVHLTFNFFILYRFALPERFTFFAENEKFDREKRKKKK